MENAITGRVHSIESFGSVDGPGVRFIAFLQGCNMRCAYCHNPDTWQCAGGEVYTPQQLLDKALRFKSYWKNSGGITISGGEPLLQIDFLLELFRLAKAEGIHTCIDTAGNPFTREEPFFSKFEQLMQVTDLLLLDLKQIDDEKHRRLTGCTNQNILDMLWTKCHLIFAGHRWQKVKIVMGDDEQNRQCFQCCRIRFIKFKSQGLG